jgi:transposase
MGIIAMKTAESIAAPAASTLEPSAVFVSLELSRSIWLVTILAASLGAKMSRYQVRGGDLPGLLKRFSDLRRDVKRRSGRDALLIVIQEAGLDGFWIHRALVAEGIESHVVDPASIAVSRRRRRAKTDRIDGEALVRTLMAWKRGEPRVCAMVRVPTPTEEDRRRLCRELKTLVGERIRHVNRLKGLFFAQGIGDYEPRNKDRRERLDELRTGDGRPLPRHLKALALRELETIELLNRQIEAVKAERDAVLDAARRTETEPAPVRMLLDLKGVGPGFAAALWSEGLFRQFENRRQVAAYAGLAPTPWKSGAIDHEQGVSKAGNPRLRAVAVEMAWLWIRHQPDSALARWYLERVRRLGPRMKKVTIVAVARKLLVALWKYVTRGVAIEGARMKTA